MRYDPVVGGNVPYLSGADIVALVPELHEIANIAVEDFGRLPGPHITAQQLFRLSRRICATVEDPDIAGVVVTHGTDTMEETAYFVDLTVPPTKPVVFTGSMRTSSEPSWDGAANLLDSVTVAASEKACGLGTMMVMSSIVLAASEAEKTHTESFDAFESPRFGPLAFIDDHRPHFFRQPTLREHYDINHVEDRVDLVTCAVGMRPVMLEAVVAANPAGIVLEGTGRGNVPPQLLPALEIAFAQKIPVVIASRSLRGWVLDSYAYPGGGYDLRQRGAILAGPLNAPKARIKLMVLLSYTQDHRVIRQAFEQKFYP